MLAGRPVRQPCAGVDFIPPVRDYESGCRTLKNRPMTEGGNYSEGFTLIIIILKVLILFDILFD
jgi:hypothetical protein